MRLYVTINPKIRSPRLNSNSTIKDLWNKHAPISCIIVLTNANVSFRQLPPLFVEHLWLFSLNS